MAACRKLGADRDGRIDVPGERRDHEQESGHGRLGSIARLKGAGSNGTSGGTQSGGSPWWPAYHQRSTWHRYGAVLNKTRWSRSGRTISRVPATRRSSSRARASISDAPPQIARIGALM